VGGIEGKVRWSNPFEDVIRDLATFYGGGKHPFSTRGSIEQTWIPLQDLIRHEKHGKKSNNSEKKMETILAESLPDPLEETISTAEF